MKRFLSQSILVLFLTSLFSLVFPIGTIAANCGGFPDLNSTDAFCESVNYVKSLGVMTGQGNGKFLPESTLNRAEAAAVLVRYLGLNESSSRTRLKKFADADVNAWYAGYFEPLLERKIFEGYPDGKLRPEGKLNKAEWLKLFYVTNSLAGDSGEKNVVDVPANAETLWYRHFLNDAIAKDFIDLDKGYFKPADGQKRKLVADLVYKIDNYKNYQAQSTTNIVVSDLEAVYQSRFGGENAHITSEAARDLPFGFNYPKSATFIWSETAANSNFALMDKIVADSQNLGKTLIGRFDFVAELNAGNKESFGQYVTKVVERYDGDGKDDMDGLKLPIKYWQFDNDNISAESYLELMKITYENAKAAGSNTNVIQGVQHDLGANSKAFWQKVYDLGGVAYFDIAMVGATKDQDFGVANYKNFLSSWINGKPLWLVKVESDGDAERFFMSCVRALAAGADKLIFTQLDSVGGGTSTFALNGDRQPSYFVAETLTTFLNRYSQVSSINNGARFQLNNNVQVYALFGDSSGLQIKKGIDYLGNELLRLESVAGLYF